MTKTYVVHYAPVPARHGQKIAHGMWDRRVSGGVNPAQCRTRATLIEFTTDPALVTCDKCVVPKPGPTDEERAATLAVELAKANDPVRHLDLAIAHVRAASVGVNAAMDAAMPHLADDDAAREIAARASAALIELANALNRAKTA